VRRPGLIHPRTPSNPAGYSSIWPPTRLPGCVAWLDCQETLTQAGTVTSIRNMASGVDWEEATNPPTYDATGINGRPCMIGNGSSMKIISNEAAVCAIVNGDDPRFTVVYVVDPNNATTPRDVGFGNSGTANNSTIFCGGNSLGRFVIEKQDDAGGFGARASFLARQAKPQVAAFVVRDFALTEVYDASSAWLSPRFTRAGFSTVNVGAITTNRAALFCRPDSFPDGFSASKLGCVLMFNRDLSRGELQGLGAALMGRWGITG
jgi:hypothetical protein